MNLVEKSAVRVIMTGPRWVINNFGLMVLMPILLLSVPCLSRAAEVSFTNVTQAAGIAYIGESWGGAWGDFNNDGYLDIWLTNHRMPTHLYRNNKNGTFTNVASQVLKNYNFDGDNHGAVWVDIDNDGDQDLVELTGAAGGVATTSPNHDANLLVNAGGVLEDRAVEMNFSNPYLRGRMPLPYDFDNDGILEIMQTGDIRSDGLAFPSVWKSNSHGYDDITDQCGAFPGAIAFAQSAAFPQGKTVLLYGGGASPSKAYNIESMPWVDNSAAFLEWQQKSVVVIDAAVADFNNDLNSEFYVARNNQLGIDYAEVKPLGNILFKVTVSPQKGETKKLVFSADGSVDFDLVAPNHNLKQIFIGSAGRNPAQKHFVLSPNDAANQGLPQFSSNVPPGLYVGFDPATHLWSLVNHTPATDRIIGYAVAGNIRATNVAIRDMSSLRTQATKLTDLLFMYDPRQGRHVVTSWGFDASTPTMAVAVADFDNDMDVDIFLLKANNVKNFANQLWLNDGSGHFVAAPDAAGLNMSVQGAGEAVIVADYDNDGFMDVLITNGYGEPPFNQGPVELFRNSGNANHWLELNLVGGPSNRDAIGARIIATTPDGRKQLREVGEELHNHGQNMRRVHFGLGANDKVASLEIHWPNGEVRTLQDIPANQILGIMQSLDTDEDSVRDVMDNCPAIANADQVDTDGDGQGDACDEDDDNDGIADRSDFAPLSAQPPTDSDGDGIADAWEMAHFGNLTSVDATSDHDHDGITDVKEFAARGNPRVAALHDSLSLVPDQTQDGVAELAMVRMFEHYARLDVVNGKTGEVLSTGRFYFNDYDPLGLVYMGRGSDSGMMEFAALAVDSYRNKAFIEIRTATGALVRSFELDSLPVTQMLQYESIAGQKRFVLPGYDAGRGQMVATIIDPAGRVERSVDFGTGSTLVDFRTFQRQGEAWAVAGMQQAGGQFVLRLRSLVNDQQNQVVLPAGYALAAIDLIEASTGHEGPYLVASQPRLVNRESEAGIRQFYLTSTFALAKTHTLPALRSLLAHGVFTQPDPVFGFVNFIDAEGYAAQWVAKVQYGGGAYRFRYLPAQEIRIAYECQGTASICVASLRPDGRLIGFDAANQRSWVLNSKEQGTYQLTGN